MEALGLVGTILSRAKGALARRHVSPATRIYVLSPHPKVPFFESDIFQRLPETVPYL